MALSESVVLLGPTHSLVGVIVRPPPEQRTDEPAVVILNTGIVHRVGHHRMYVDLSRLLAQQGRTVVRFDFSGIGDSRPRTDGLPPLEAAMADIREVLDSLQSAHQISRFVLVGLCSGADQAVLYARTDDRVVNVLLMDPTLPPTPRYYVHYVLQRLSQVKAWKSVLKGRSGLMGQIADQLRHLRRKSGQAPEEGCGTDMVSLYNLRYSPQLRASYQALGRRGVGVLAIFTALSPRHTYPRQFLDAFPEVSACTQLQFLPECDHLFSSMKQRQCLFDLAQGWLRSV